LQTVSVHYPHHGERTHGDIGRANESLAGKGAPRTIELARRIRLRRYCRARLDCRGGSPSGRELPTATPRKIAGAERLNSKGYLCPHERRSPSARPWAPNASTAKAIFALTNAVGGAAGVAVHRPARRSRLSNGSRHHLRATEGKPRRVGRSVADSL
jgi:hypothetical protein